MTPYVRDSLHFTLLRQLFSLLLLLLKFKALGRRLKLLLVHDKEMAGSALGEIWLRQNVLNACDR